MTRPVRLQWARTPQTLPPACLEPNRVSGDLRLIAGNNLPALAALGAEFAGSVTLAYLDPPFLTGKQHHRVTRRKESGTGKILRHETMAFDDRWNGMAEYLDALGPRLEAVRPLISAEGSVVVHVDSKTSHYVRVMCDEIFGPDAFASEIIWRYRRWPTKTPNFQRMHDVLLRYVKDPRSKPRFNQLYEPLAPSTVATWGTRKQRAVTNGDGRRVRSSSTDTDTPGAPLGDVWEIGIVAPVAKERTGYPTQKPEALLERLIQSLTDAGDWVLDPYAGSGTTLAVAGRLGRKVLSIDQGAESLEVMKSRCQELGLELVEQKVRSVPSRVAKAS